MNRYFFTLLAFLIIFSSGAFPQQSVDNGNKISASTKSLKDCSDCPEMVFVPAGNFDMGSNTHDEEKPIHHVTIARPFAIGKTEVTQGQWKSIMGNNPSYFLNCGDGCPVEQVSWNDVKDYIQKLNAKTGKQYRLPSEAEWEYACKIGVPKEYCGSDNVEDVAWYGAYSSPKGNSKKSTNPVATKLPNVLGLYDMSGNVWEWVEDSYYDNYNDENRNAPTDGSAWQGDGEMRVIRGGSWDNEPQNVRATGRGGEAPIVRNYDYGFRLARSLP